MVWIVDIDDDDDGEGDDDDDDDDDVDDDDDDDEDGALSCPWEYDGQVLGNQAILCWTLFANLCPWT